MNKLDSYKDKVSKNYATWAGCFSENEVQCIKLECIMKIFKHLILFDSKRQQNNTYYPVS